MSKKSWCVYEHVFPNGKKYIGITSMPPEKRWNNGWGYYMQPKISKAIEKYGWENITHSVIADGLDKENAMKLEKYLIASLETIEDGYNTAIGGNDCGNATYLDSYVLDMIRGDKKYRDENEEGWLADTVYAARFDPDAASFWNEASRAVTYKWGEYSSTSDRGTAFYWWHMAEYFELAQMNWAGEDTSEWFETYHPWERISPEKEKRLRKGGDAVEEFGMHASERYNILDYWTFVREYGEPVAFAMYKYGISVDDARGRIERIADKLSALEG